MLAGFEPKYSITTFTKFTAGRTYHEAMSAIIVIVCFSFVLCGFAKIGEPSMVVSLMKWRFGF